MTTLHCFQNKSINGDADHSEVVSAYSAEDARNVLQQCAEDSFGDTELSYEFEQIDDQDMVVVWTDDGRGRVEQTARQWTEEIGRGLVSSMHFC